jgi:hypothetical protein
MMRKACVGAALICAALFGVAACGSGSGSPGTFVPKGSLGPTPTSQSSADASVAASGLARFPFPSSVHIEFQTPLPADQQDASVVVTDEDFQLAYYYSLYSEGGNQRFASYIASQTVQTAVQASVAQNFTEHERIRGTLRIFDTTVSGVAGAPSDLAVSFCGDNSQLVSVSARTGQVVPDNTPADHDYFRETDSYLPEKGGKWGLAAITVTFYPNGPAKECKP